MGAEPAIKEGVLLQSLLVEADQSGHVIGAADALIILLVIEQKVLRNFVEVLEMPLEQQIGHGQPVNYGHHLEDEVATLQGHSFSHGYAPVALQQLEPKRLQLFLDLTLGLQCLAVPGVVEGSPQFQHRLVEAFVQAPLAHPFRFQHEALFLNIEAQLHSEIYLVLEFTDGFEQTFLSLVLLLPLLPLETVVLVAFRLLRTVSCRFGTRGQPSQI